MMRTTRATYPGGRRYGRGLRAGLFLIGPIEFGERRASDAAGLEPPVALGLASRAVRPSPFFRDVEWAGRIDRWFVTMRLAHADELDEGAIHSL
jgi:hypothetical protein